MSKAIVNSLAMALAMEENPDCPWSLQDSLAFATTWVEQNIELFGPPVIVDFQGRALGPQPIATVPPSVGVSAIPVMQDIMQAAGVATDPETGVPLYGNETWQARKERGTGDQAVAAKHIQHVVGPDGLTDAQRVALAKGVGLCPNCQQSNERHLPGCLRDPANGFTDKERGRAVTKAKLPPAAG